MASPSQNGDETWFSVGLASSYPNITESGNITLSDTIATSCEDDNSILMPGCKVFTVPDGAENGNEDMRVTQLSTNPKEQITASLRRGEQVLVFRYQGRIFAVDNKCPHSSYPLSNGTPFDIEDFGIVLSKGITCPKHSWSFDLFTGRGDRGGFRLKLWEVEVRGGEVWVRKKARGG